ncbi:MAG TPA: DUF5606 domain-containing protein [Puia sp.]|nr:DUF5606 domain-containing protein [Puia sp.]
MEYNKIVAVTGLPGLYELLSSKTDGAIVRSLDDKSTKFVSSRIHNFSHLESIEIFTKRENVNLVDVLKAIDESKEKLPDEKDNAALKSYFSKVYPDLDFDRVYSSDLKKMIKWFSVLKSNNIEFKLSEPPVEEEQKPEEEVKEEKVVAEEPVAKPKKAAAKKVREEEKEPKKETAEETEAKPKKAAAKKKTDK